MQISQFGKHCPRSWGPPWPESRSNKLPGASWTMHLIPACRPCQRQYRLWHLLATGQGELLSRRTRRGRPQAHRLPTLFKEDRARPANKNNYSESFVGRRKGKRFFFFFCRKCLGEHGPCWVGKCLPGRWLETWRIPYSTLPDEVPSALVVRAVKWLIEKASAQHPNRTYCFPISA